MRGATILRPAGRARPMHRAAQQLAAADPAGWRQIEACIGCQDAVEWGRRCPSRRAAELEAVGRQEQSECE